MQPPMSGRERKRLRATYGVAAGEGAVWLTQARAGEPLGLSERLVRRLVKRYREQGGRPVRWRRTSADPRRGKVGSAGSRLNHVTSSGRAPCPASASAA